MTESIEAVYNSVFRLDRKCKAPTNLRHVVVDAVAALKHDMDEAFHGPGLFQTAESFANVTIDSLSDINSDLLPDHLKEWANGCPNVTVHDPIYLRLSDIENEDVRRHLLGIGTRLALPNKQTEDLRCAGRSVFHSKAGALAKELGYSSIESGCKYNPPPSE